MKKVIIIAAAVLAIACLASCKKSSKKCLCTATVMGVTVTAETEAEDGNCTTLNYSAGGVSYSCK